MWSVGRSRLSNFNRRNVKMSMQKLIVWGAIAWGAFYLWNKNKQN